MPETLHITSNELKIKTKQNNIAGLQLADLVAHPSRREILLLNKRIEEKSDKPFSNEIIRIIQDKYDKEGEKIYGRKLLP